jgi:acyl carrier protein
MFDQVFAQLRTIVCERLDIPPETFTPEASFIEQLGADSLDLIDLILLVEEQFELQIPDEDYVHFATVQQAVEYIANHAQKIEALPGATLTLAEAE